MQKRLITAETQKGFGKLRVIGRIFVQVEELVKFQGTAQVRIAQLAAGHHFIRSAAEKPQVGFGILFSEGGLRFLGPNLATQNHLII